MGFLKAGRAIHILETGIKEKKTNLAKKVLERVLLIKVNFYQT